MLRPSSVELLKTLVHATQAPRQSSITGDSPPSVPCGVSPSSFCASVRCGECRYVPQGVWACMLCVTALNGTVYVLPYHSDHQCHYCGASPLLTLRVTPC